MQTVYCEEFRCVSGVGISGEFIGGVTGVGTGGTTGGTGWKQCGTSEGFAGCVEGIG